jgi:G3E family GTPase
MSGGVQHPPWPLALLTGFLGAGKTTLISRWLSRSGLADTAVLVNEFGELGLDHHLIRAITDNVILLPGGCLCCRMRGDLPRALRDLHLAWSAGRTPDFARVIVETSGLAEPAPLVAALVAHPLVHGVFSLASVTTLVDGEQGAARLADNATCRRQICAADHLVVTKCDLIGAAAIELVEQRLAVLNPLADIHRSGGGQLGVDPLFARAPAIRSAGSRTGMPVCDDSDDHLSGVSHVVLRTDGCLSWPKFQMWLNDLVEISGARMLRLKGCLRFDENRPPVVLQGVRHTFYPIEEAPPQMGSLSEYFLTLIFEGEPPADLNEGFMACRGIVTSH